MVVDPGWLETLVGELGRDPSLGAVQPKLLFAGREPATVNSVGVTIGRDGAGTDIGYGELDDGRFDTPIDLRCCTGGAVLLRVAMLRQVGLFDQRLFMYYEDVDLCLRGASAGWKFRCLPSARVWHIGSATADTMASTAVFHRERNRLWMLFRWAPWTDVARGLWLSVRRLRHPPRAAHARALAAGIGEHPASSGVEFAVQTAADLPQEFVLFRTERQSPLKIVNRPSRVSRLAPILLPS